MNSHDTHSTSSPFRNGARLNKSIRTGLTIGTFASVPYVHLQLESRRRFCPEVPCLVQDDGSPEGARLKALCDAYGAEFMASDTRHGHVVGDMCVFLNGLEWARMRQLDWLVKFSRRWIPVAPWHKAMVALLEESDAPTLSGRCTYHGFGFRSECVAMKVAPWLGENVTAPIVEEIGRGHSDLVEAVIHRAAANAFESRSERCRAFEVDHPHHESCGGYIAWPWMQNSRVNPRADVLWHEWARAHEYHRALNQWGIHEYSPADFIDPAANVNH